MGSLDVSCCVLKSVSDASTHSAAKQCHHAWHIASYKLQRQPTQQAASMECNTQLVWDQLNRWRLYGRPDMSKGVRGHTYLQNTGPGLNQKTYPIQLGEVSMCSNETAVC